MFEAEIKFSILMAEDDEDYFKLTKEAVKKSGFIHELFWVKDGEECMDFLLHRGKYSPPHQPEQPSIILLDLNMPRKNGHETLQEIKKNPGLRHIPVVILTISRSREDVLLSYFLGANSFVRKPLGFNQLVTTMDSFYQYWVKTTELPVETTH
jgi:CheY-like chemotaxis protein